MLDFTLLNFVHLGSTERAVVHQEGLEFREPRGEFLFDGASPFCTVQPLCVTKLRQEVQPVASLESTRLISHGLSARLQRKLLALERRGPSRHPRSMLEPMGEPTMLQGEGTDPTIMRCVQARKEQLFSRPFMLSAITQLLQVRQRAKREARRQTHLSSVIS